MATLNFKHLEIEKPRKNMLSYKVDIKKILTVFYILNFIHVISAQHVETLPLTADGWRPIISNRPSQPDIKYYQDSVAEATRQHTITTTSPYLNQQNQINHATAKPQPQKQQQQQPLSNSQPQTNNQLKNGNQGNNQDHTKQQKHNSGKIRTNPNVIPAVNLGKIFGGNQDIILHGNYPSTRNHGHNVKAYSTISPYVHNYGSVNTHRHPVMSKLQAHMTLSKRRKPSQHHSATTRDEVYLSPPSGILGSYPFFHTAPIKGLATVHHGSVGKHYILPGTLPPHIEFPNHYSPVSIVNDDLIKQLVRDNNAQIGNQYFYSKHTHQNNLASPPPFKTLYSQETQQHQALPEHKQQKLENIKVYTTVATINDPQIVVGKQRFTDAVKKPEKDKVIVPENIVVQLPPPHNSEHYLQKPKMEVEITKENFNVFQNDIPPNYNPHPHLENFYASDAKTSPSQNNAHTYEVTEGKYDETTSYPLLAQKNSKTKFVNQISSSVDDQQDKVTFLPTPYKPTKNRTTVYDSYFDANFDNTQSHYLTQTDLNKYQYNHFDDLPTQLSVPSKDSERINYAPNEITTVFEYDTPSGSTASPSSHHYTVQQNVDTTVQSTTERYTRRPKITTTTTIIPQKSTRTYPRTRNPNRRRRPSTKPTFKTTTATTPSNENQVGTQVPDESKIVETEYQTTTVRVKYPKPYRTTPAPVSQETQTVPQTTLAPTVQTRHKYKNTAEQYDEDTGKLLKKHRVRPTDFVDDFEDSEYLQSKYQEFDSPKASYNNRYKNHKQHYTQEETETEPTEEYFSKRNHHKNIRNKSTYENQDYSNFESTKPSEIETLSSKVYPTEFFSSNTEYTIPQKYTKTTTTDSSQLDGQESIENFEITKITENEVDYKTQKETTTTNEIVKEIPTTKFSNIFDKIEIKEIITTQEPETTTFLKSTTTTAETTTPKAYRVRPKPNRYDGNRPRFSVKDYRQRLYTSTTEATKLNQESTSTRIRFPPKLRITTSTVPPSSEETTNNEEDSTENIPNRQDIRKFVPKESRYKPTTEKPVVSSTEKTYNSYRPNRIRPTTAKHYGTRYRSTSTTESTNSAAVIPPPKVVIKPSSALIRRPQTISLRNRIANRQKTQDTSTASSSTTSEQSSSAIETTKSQADDAQSTFSSMASAETSYTSKWNLRPESSSHRFNIEELFDQSSERNSQQHTTTSDNNQTSDDDDSYSQRIADLTSLSANQNQDKNGVFKTVPSNTSRRVPNYFTIATDDPILPIEAFFPQISQKESSKSK